MNKKPSLLDFVLLCAFVVFITFQPYYLHHEIIMMETGIHLPVINALFHGAVPYRDVFFLRGPLELYVPTIMMFFFGKNSMLLPTFFYIGTVLTLLAGVLLAQQLYRTRFIFYIMVAVFVARTFPRVSYYYWGGLRYFIGLASLYLAIQCFKKNRLSFMFAAGVCSALSFLTTIEAGVSESWEKYTGQTSAFIPGTSAHRFAQGRKMVYMSQEQAQLVDRLDREYAKILGFR